MTVAPASLAIASATIEGGGGMTSPGALTIISTVANSVSRTVKLDTFPVALAVSPSGRTAYVAGVGGDEDGEPGTLWPVNTATGSVGKAINVGTDPTAVALAPNGLTAYVVCSYDAATQAPTGSVRLVSTTTDKAGKVVKVAAGPTAITFTPDGRTAFVLGANAVTPIATVSGTARPSIKLQASAVAVTPDSKTAYFVGHTVPGPLEVFPVSTATGSYEKGVPTGAWVPDADAISPNGQYVYVVGTPDPGLGAKDDAVSVISTATNRVAKTIDLGDHPSANAWQIVMSPDGKTAYAWAFGTPTQAGMVVPVNTATATAGKPISVGDDAASVVFSANSKWAYVLDDGYKSGASRSAGGVLAINVASGVAGKVLPVAAYADAMAEP
jgi:YVTN family beta-propeller protein